MNMLPSLPKKRQKKEADFGLRFRKWIEAECPPTGAYEHKSTRGRDSLPFAELKDIQMHHGLKVKKKGDLIRVVSGTVGAADYIWLYKEPSWVVIEYPQGFVIIDIEIFRNEAKTSVVRSLYWNRAIEICFTKVLTK